MATTLTQKYAVIADLLISPAFYEPPMHHCRSRKLNRWCNFWNYLGARNHSNHRYGYFCVVCGEPIQKKDKTYRVCQKHQVKYAKDVKSGKISNPATFEVYAVVS